MRSASRAGPRRSSVRARQRFLKQGFCEVVIAAKLEPFHSVLDFIACGQEEHGRIFVFPEFLEHFPSVHARQHDIKNDQIVVPVDCVVQAIPSSRRKIDNER
jgi:hypothetical protein